MSFEEKYKDKKRINEVLEQIKNISTNKPLAMPEYKGPLLNISNNLNNSNSDDFRNKEESDKSIKYKLYTIDDLKNQIKTTNIPFIYNRESEEKFNIDNNTNNVNYTNYNNYKNDYNKIYKLSKENDKKIIKLIDDDNYLYNTLILNENEIDNKSKTLNKFIPFDNEFKETQKELKLKETIEYLNFEEVKNYKEKFINDKNIFSKIFRFNYNSIDKNNNTLLMLLCKYNKGINKDMINYLSNEIKSVNKDNKTALMFLCENYKNKISINIIKLLSNEIGMVDKNKNTALIYYLKNKNHNKFLPIVDLLNNEIDINKEEINKLTKNVFKNSYDLDIDKFINIFNSPNKYLNSINNIGSNNLNNIEHKIKFLRDNY